jgi:alkylation response protein AidB-like acyl-CoA dehydrogenase
LNRLQQMFLASRAEAIYGGTTQIQYNVLSERTLGLPREPRRT